MVEAEYRHEYKYPMTEGQRHIQEAKIMGMAEKDKFVGEKGYYNIRSLYFDDYYNSSYLDNVNGVDQREKFRIRIYNGSKDKIKLESKQKVRGKNFKESCDLTLQQCMCLMEGQVPKEIDSNQKILLKLAYFMRTRLMRPAVIVDYDRIPYVYRPQDANVRITFDRNLMASEKIDDFFTPKLYGRSIFANQQLLMEVKYDQFLPDEIRWGLQMDQMEASTFSKYYLCRKFRG